MDSWESKIADAFARHGDSVSTCLIVDPVERNRKGTNSKCERNKLFEHTRYKILKKDERVETRDERFSNNIRAKCHYHLSSPVCRLAEPFFVQVPNARLGTNL